MMSTKGVVTFCSVAALGLTLSLLGAGDAALGQSPIVFMTAEETAAPPISRLHRFDNGVETFGVTAAPNSAFLGVTVLNGQVLVADFTEERIQRYTPAGVLLAPFTLFSNPTFLESDTSGNVYTTPFSVGAPMATRFNSAGAVTQTYAHVDMTQAAGVDADAAGNVYVVDNAGPGGNSIFKFAADGTFLSETLIGSIVGRDISIDEAGNRLFLADDAGGASGVKIFDISGAAPSLVGTITTPANSNTVGVHFAAESGNILATDLGTNSLNPRGREYSPAGVFLREYIPTDADVAWDIVTLVPEPSSLVLLSMGVIGLGVRSRSGRA